MPSEALPNTTPAPVSRTSAVDCRRWSRRPSAADCFCGSLADGNHPRYPARIRDLSAGGIGLITQRYHAPGSVVVVRMEPLNSENCVLRLAQVIHCRIIPSIGWVLGCQFGESLDDGELRELLTVGRLPQI